MPISYNPSQLNFPAYKKNTPSAEINVLLTAQTSVFNFSYNYLKLQSKPNWLTVIITSHQKDVPWEQYVQFTVKINEAIAKTMYANDYSGKIIFQYGRETAIPALNLFPNTVELPVNIKIIDPVVFNITPTNLNYQYTIGGSIPGAIFVNVTSENSWVVEKNQSWIILSKTNGNGSSSLSVSVDPSGLTAGVYTGSVLVNDGHSTPKIATVTLTVKGENTAEEFLVVFPESLQFTESVGAAPTQSKQITIESSDIFDITSNVAWLSLSAASGPSGITIITVSTVSTSGLAAGSHNAMITVTNNFTVKNISVLLVINDSVVFGIGGGGFYYAEDRNKVGIVSNNPNNELYIEFDTQSDKQISYEKTAPFFHGVAEIIVGLETKNLLKENNVLDNFNTGVFNPVTPLSMTMRVYEKPVNSTQKTLKQNIQGARFINGYKPGTGKASSVLSYMPELINTTKDAVIMFSFRSLTAPSQIEISGAITDIIGVNASDELQIYTVRVNLSDYNLTPGDLINITVTGISVSADGITRSVNIIDTEPEHTKLIWLNEWQCPEPMMLTGALEIIPGSDNKTTTVAKNGKEYTKTIDVKNPIEYRVNSGYVYSRAERNWLATALGSKKVWLEVDGSLVEVIPKTKSIPTYKTRRFENAYSLIFEKAEV